LILNFIGINLAMNETEIAKKMETPEGRKELGNLAKQMIVPLLPPPQPPKTPPPDFLVDIKNRKLKVGQKVVFTSFV
jgi:hypothetical protein